MSNVHVTLKLATSMDGRIALADGTSQWITGSQSRARVHDMRAAHGAILVGVGTVLADDPLLTARTVPLPAKQPIRIIADSNARTPVNGRLLASKNLGDVVIATVFGTDPGELPHAGAKVWRIEPSQSAGISPAGLLHRAEIEGLKSIFLEGGGKLAASFVKAGLVDTIQWFRAPIIIGGDGFAAIADLGLTDMGATSRWSLTATERIGDDVLDTYVKA